MPTRILREPAHVEALARTKKCASCGAAFERDPRYSRKYFARQKYCSQACSAISFQERNAEIYGNPLDRFFAFVEKRDDGCWMWTGPRCPGGYGQISIGGKKQRAHRFSLRHLGGGVADGQLACHKCDRPWCVNPEHLYAGNYVSNGVDAVKRGRRKGQKLTEADVRSIICSTMRDSDLAAQHNVSKTMIRAIKSRRKWAHVEVGDAD